MDVLSFLVAPGMPMARGRSARRAARAQAAHGPWEIRKNSKESKSLRKKVELG
jgi:hypothetical protein